MFSPNSHEIRKIFAITVKELEPATSCNIDQGVATVPTRHVRDRN